MFLVLIFGCILPQNQSAGSYFAMFLFAGFYCTGLQEVLGPCRGSFGASRTKTQALINKKC